MALGTPVTGNRVPELQPLTWAEIDPADGHPVATTREGQFKARKGASDGGEHSGPGAEGAAGRRPLAAGERRGPHLHSGQSVRRSISS